MKLIVQPDAGIAPIVTAIKQAKRSIDILIFRLDRSEITQALEAAVSRGVRVRALTAHTNRGGTKSLRKLEMHLLEAGVTVSRTADDLVRYHGKMMIVDGKILHVYGFNFTGLDIAKSRSFGIISKNKKLINEANRLFTADFDRLPYSSGYERFVVSPDNARERLARFIKGARKQLLIYDPQATDDAMLRLVAERVKAGVDVRIIGKARGEVGRHHQEREVSGQAAAHPRDHPRRQARVPRQPEPAAPRAREAARGRRHRHRRDRREADAGRLREGLGADAERRKKRRRKRRPTKAEKLQAQPRKALRPSTP